MRKKIGSFVLVLFVAILGAAKADDESSGSFLRRGITSTNSSVPVADEEVSGNATTTRAARRLMMACNYPDDFYYTATMQIAYFTAPSRTCTSSEISGFKDLLDDKFDEYTAFHEVLGPLDLVRMGATCRRELGGGGVIDESENVDQQEDDNQAVLLVRRGTLLPGDSVHKDDSRRRQLMLRPNWGFYTGGGNCRYCRPDNTDNRRRRRLNTNNFPITVTVGTDAYPAETAYELTATDGSFHYVSGGFSTAHTEYHNVHWLESGKNYIVKVTDTYGDGFCCSHGDGYLKVYAGTTPTGVLRTSITSFGSVASRNFFTHGSPSSTAPPSSSGMTPADAFPALQAAMGEWLTYYLQQAHQYQYDSCLFLTRPFVEVTLTPATQSEAMSVC